MLPRTVVEGLDQVIKRTGDRVQDRLVQAGLGLRKVV
jgi:hypothetical protein